MAKLTKKYYRIGDVAELLDVSQTTLRYWESEFPEIEPRRSASNRRYYTPEDVETLRMIQFLVKVRGLRVEAAKEQMRLNHKNISRRMEIMGELTDVRDELELILKALEKRR